MPYIIYSEWLFADSFFSQTAIHLDASSDIVLAYPMAVYARSISLLAYPTAKYTRSISRLAYPNFHHFFLSSLMTCSLLKCNNTRVILPTNRAVSKCKPMPSPIILIPRVIPGLFLMTQKIALKTNYFTMPWVWPVEYAVKGTDITRTTIEYILLTALGTVKVCPVLKNWIHWVHYR